MPFGRRLQLDVCWFLLLCLAASSGCGRIGFEWIGGQGDGGPSADAAPGRDGSARDGAIRDGASMDGNGPADTGVGIDGGERTDGGSGSVDGGSNDGGSSDAGSSDAGSSDAGSSDAGSSDAGPADASTAIDSGAPAPRPCNFTEEFTYSGGDMAVCRRARYFVQACVTESMSCNTAGGWHLCTSSEYLARGGRTVVPLAAAWIGGCVRFGPTMAPTDAICASCARNNGVAQEVAWRCDDGTPRSTSRNRVGLVTSATCHRVGIDDPSTEGYWQNKDADATADGAVCCR